MSRKLTPSQLGAHDFYRAMRVAGRHIQPLQLFERIIQERAKILASALKALAFSVGGALWLASAKSDLTVKLSIFDLSLPAAYVNVAVSVAFAGFVLGLVNYFELNEFARIISHRMLKFDSSWALGTLYDGGSAWSLVLAEQFRYFQSDTCHKFIGRSIMLLSNLPILIASAIVLWTVGTVGISTLAANGVFSLKGVLTVLAWVSVIIPFAIVAMMRTRLIFNKNTSFIRWNFLVPMYRRVGRWPPKMNSWLSKSPIHSPSQPVAKQ